VQMDGGPMTLTGNVMYGGNSIYVGSANNAFIGNYTNGNNRGYDLGTTGLPTNNRFVSNVIYNSTAEGVLIYSATRSGNTFLSNTFISANSASPGLAANGDSTLIVGNIAYSNSGDGIDVGSDNNALIGNYVYSNSGGGVTVSGTGNMWADGGLGYSTA